MSASGINLKPVRMSDIKASQPKTVIKYIPPNKRTLSNSKNITSIEENDFPSLGLVNKTNDSSANSMEFKKQVLNLIAKDQVDELERNRQPELNWYRMTDVQLENNGWAILQIQPDIIQRFNEFMESIPTMYRLDEDL
jgi:hypothetical protein